MLRVFQPVLRLSQNTLVCADPCIDFGIYDPC